MIYLKADHLKLVLDILNKHVPDREVRAFGSRTDLNASENSDLDLVIMGAAPVGWRIMSALRNDFEESLLPIKVDIMDWNDIPENFKNNINKRNEIIKSLDQL